MPDDFGNTDYLVLAIFALGMVGLLVLLFSLVWWVIG